MYQNVTEPITMDLPGEKQSGFTLIELMIAVGIVSIAVAVALPNFSRWHVQSQLRQATAEIATQLTLARMAAMNRNRTVDVTLQTSGNALHISAVSSTGTVLNDKTFPASVASVIGSPLTISFSSMGLRTSGGTGTQTIGVCDIYKRQYSVTIIPAGKVNWSVNPGAIACP
jgi:prepilin-type N-terminal cleavage/methylation domain-containing protein